MLKILHHVFLEKSRRVYSNKKIVLSSISIVMGIFVLFNLGILCYYLPEYIPLLFEDAPIVPTFIQYSIYLILLSIPLRFFFQKQNTLNLKPYLTLPISKNLILHYPLLASLLKKSIAIPLLILFSFSLTILLEEFSFGHSLVWLFCLSGLIFLSNYLSLFLRYVLSSLKWGGIIVLSILGGGFYTIDLIDASLADLIINLLGNTPRLALFTLFVWIGVLFFYSISFFALKQNYYQLNKDKNKLLFDTGSFGKWLSNSGSIGNLINLEVKLILRNRRPRIFLLMAFAMLFIMVNVYTGQKTLNTFLLMIFMSTLSTGAFQFQYCQFLFAWESTFFDGLISKNIPLSKIISAKYYLLGALCILPYFISLGFVFFSSKVFLYSTMLLFFNIGISPFFMILFGLYNTDRIKIDTSPFMNYEGLNIYNSFFIMIPLIIPLILAVPFYFFEMETVGLYTLGGIGILGFLLRNKIIVLIAHHFKTRKHSMALGFRK